MTRSLWPVRRKPARARQRRPFAARVEAFRHPHLPCLSEILADSTRDQPERMTFGTLAEDKSNVILYPTSYSAQHTDTQFMVGDGSALDPSQYFIVVLNLTIEDDAIAPGGVFNASPGAEMFFDNRSSYRLGMKRPFCFGG